jgi:hypothetical protein
MTNKTRTIFTLLILSLWLMTSSPLIAQTPQLTEYKLLAPIPQLSTNADGSQCVKDGKPCATASTFIPGLIKLIIALAGALAVLRLIFAGVKYMSTDAFSGKNEAKGIIENALWGLFLAMGAWLILYTINPKLVEINLSIENVGTNAPLAGTGSTTSGTPSTSGGLTHDAVLNALSPEIRPYAGQCQNGATTGCVDLAGLQQKTIDGLKDLAKACNGCGTLILTGGTEDGHTTNSAHNTGSAVDMRGNTALNAVIAESKRLTACNVYTSSQFPGRFLWEPRGSTCGGTVPSSNDHWHVTY